MNDEINCAFPEECERKISLSLDEYQLTRQWTCSKAKPAADFVGWEQDAQVENVIRALRADGGGRERAPEGTL